MLLDHFRSDRRKLIEFIISSNLIKAIEFPAGTSGIEDVNLDIVSADYVLECTRNGRVLDVSEAARMRYDEMNLPTMINSESGCSFFLVTEPELSCSPPHRAPPEFVVSTDSSVFPCSSNTVEDFVDDRFGSFDNDCGHARTSLSFLACEPLDKNHVPPIGLPSLLTDLSEDDLRDTAYEILVVSLVHSGHLPKLSSTSGSLVQPTESKIKDRRTRFLLRQKNKEYEDPPLQTQSASAHSEVLDVIRTQMEISEVIDRCARQGLSHVCLSMDTGKLDVPKISVELLNSVSKSGFSSERAYMRWIKRQAKVLEEVLHSHSLSRPEKKLKSILADITNEEVLAAQNASSQLTEIFTDLQRSVREFSDTQKEFGVSGEACFSEMAYHVNLRLYEKLLSSTFDSLDGQLIEFASIGEPAILELAMLELQKVQSLTCDDNEAAYLSSLNCTTYSYGSQRTVGLLSAIALSIGMWCDFQLSDYHLHFYKSSSNFEKVVTSAVVVDSLINSGFDKINGSGESIKLKESTSEKVMMYIMASTKAACERALNGLEAGSNPEATHPLALFADELRLIAGNECRIFNPVLSRWYLEAKEKFALLVHEFYGEKLKPFLAGLSQLSSDARCVLPSAYLLENDLAQFVYYGEDVLTAPLVKGWHPYQVGRTAYPLIQDWIDVQSRNILEWTERAYHLEIWEPLSSLQKHGSSIVEVFRIIEETVDQFFSLRLPVGVKHTRCLLIGIAGCLERYMQKVSSQLVDKNNLYPAMPALTRYEEAIVNPFIKKKFIECKLLEENVHRQLKDLTVFKLCILANTLHYIGNQVRTLEDTIRNHCLHVRICEYDRTRGSVDDTIICHHLQDSNGELLLDGELIEELLVPFDCVQRIANDITNQICDFVGAKVVFWDLREPFLFHLYRGNVENARLETVLEQLDIVLNNVCSLISDPLRDVIVRHIFLASLDGYIWVLLDGGPSRVFTESDVLMLQEDLNILKEFFIADGEGLFRALIEKESLTAQEILDLYALQTETVIQRLMAASEQISTEFGQVRPRSRSAEEADTLLRVLCHKGDSSASKFLKIQYNLPKSSDYEDGSSFRSPVFSEIFTRSTSSQWTQKGQMGMRTMKKKLQKVKSELMYGGW